MPFQDLAVRSHMGRCAGPCQGDFLAAVRAEFEANACLVRIGLTRQYPPEDTRPGCWLQVTNLLARPRSHFLR